MARAAGVGLFGAAVVSLAFLGWIVWADERDERPELRASYAEVVVAELVLVGIPAALLAACAGAIRRPRRRFALVVAVAAAVVGVLLTMVTFGVGGPVALVLWACAGWIFLRRASFAR